MWNTPWVAKCWGSLYPKVQNFLESKISDFRPIALPNVEGKLFFSLVSRRLENHLIKKIFFYKHLNAERIYREGSWFLGALDHDLGALKEACQTKANLATI